MIGQSITRRLDISSIICSSYGFLSPTALSMMTQVAGGLGVTLVEKATDKPGLTMAVARTTLENVGLTTLNILDRRSGLEKDIDRCIPLL